MKNTKFIFGLLASSFFTTSAYAVAPSQVNVTIHEVWLATKADCSNPIKVIDNGADGRTSNLVYGPDLGEGTLPPDDSYNCLIIVLKDKIQVVPSANGSISGQTTCQKDSSTIEEALTCNDIGCIADTPIDQTTCNGGAAQADDLPDGTPAACDGSGGKVAAFFSTSGTPSGDGHKASTAKKMAAPIVIAGAATNVTFSMYDPVGLKSEQDGTGCGQTQHASMEIKQ